MTLNMEHQENDRINLSVEGKPILSYVYQSTQDRYEAPKPYIHPLRSLDGDLLTNFRPFDHIWHHGLAMTCPHLSGSNFWGGNTFDKETKKYLPLNDSGVQSHQDWKALSCTPDKFSGTHNIQWLDKDEKLFFQETRTLTVDEVNVSEGRYSLSFAHTLENQSGQELHWGSPTTQGRPDAGYGGLFWRGPREWMWGTVHTPEGETESVRGSQAPWLSYSGKHDGSNRQSTLIFIDHPENPRYPTTWFVRSSPFACASFAFAFHEEMPFADGSTTTFRYKMVIANGALEKDLIQTIAEKG